MFVYDLFGELGLGIGERGLIAYGSEGHTTGLHARFIVEQVGIEETATTLIFDERAFTFDIFAFQGHGLQRNASTIPGEDGLQEYRHVLGKIFLRDSTRELDDDLVVHGGYRIRNGLIPHLARMSLHVRQTFASDKHDAQHGNEKENFFHVCYLWLVVRKAI